MASTMTTYKAPSNLKPTLLFLFVGLIYPVVLTLRVLNNPLGLHSLTVTRVVIFLVVEWVLLRYYTISNLTTPLLTLPRPGDESWLLGNGHTLIRRPQVYNFTKVSRGTPNEGLIFIRGILHISRHVMVTSPAALNEILNTKAYDFIKPSEVRKFLGRVLGNGLILSEGAVHKQQRKEVAPAFHGKHIRALVPLFWAKAEQMADVIFNGKTDDAKIVCAEKGKREVELEISALASRATLDIIGKAGFGRDFNTLENSEDELAKSFETILDPKKGLLILYFVVNILLPDWLVRSIPWKMNQRINAAAARLRKICAQLIAEKRQEIALEKLNEEGESKTEKHILGVLLRSSEMTEDGLVDQMLTFLAAGHETTSSALTWACYLLGENPEIQSKLRAELQASPLATGKTATADIIDSLLYLQAVCAETLRFYPTVPVTARRTVRDTTIQGQVLPKGIEVFFSPWTVNRDKRWWGEDADEFLPDRWLKDGAEGLNTMNTCEFITFLHGPRSCIGQGFAKYELACLLAKIVLAFDIKLAEGWAGKEPEPAGAVTIKPKDGMRLVLREIVA